MTEAVIHPKFGPVLVSPDGSMVAITNEQFGEFQNQSPQMLGALINGVRSGFNSVAAGGADLYERAFGDSATADQITETEAGRERAFQQANADQPIAANLGTVAPYATAAVAAEMIPGGQGFAAQFARQALAAGMTGFIDQPGGLDERVVSGIEEGALGGAGQAAARGLDMASRVAQGIVGRYATRKGVMQADKAERFRASGGQQSPAQRLDSDLGKRGEAVIETIGGMDEAKRINNELLEQKLGRAMGIEPGPNGRYDLSSAGFGEASDQIGARFNEALLGGNLKVKLPQRLADEIRDVGATTKFMKLGIPKGEINSRTYAQLRGDLNKIRTNNQQARSSQAGLDETIADIMARLDGEFIEAAGPDAAIQLRQAREQWKVMETAQRGRAITPDGEINAATLNNNMTSKSGFDDTARREKTANLLPETRDLVEFSNDSNSRFAKSAFGDSGTQTRSFKPIAAQAVASGVPGAAAYLAVTGNGGSHEEGVAAAALAAVSGRSVLKNYGRYGSGASQGILGAPGAITAQGLFGGDE
jgi:hypothetical protein